MSDKLQTEEEVLYLIAIIRNEPHCKPFLFEITSTKRLFPSSSKQWQNLPRRGKSPTRKLIPRPPNPIEFVANYLLKNNPENAQAQ
jgi:hypothetical protein